jgi:hypothetical protein
MKHSGGAGVNEDVWYIAVIHAKEAKYMQKHPNDSNKTRFCLTKDDMDLRVTICHIQEDWFRTGAHILPISEVNSAIVATAKPEAD